MRSSRTSCPTMTRFTWYSTSSSEGSGASLDASKVETNIVIFEVDDPQSVIAALAERGVEMGQMGPGRIRAVTHLDVDRAAIDQALAALSDALAA